MTFLVVREQVSLESLHTFASLGQAQKLVELTAVDQLEQITAQWAAWPQPIWVLGSGSNIVFAGDFPGTLILNLLKGRDCLSENTTQNTAIWRVSAGECWHDWVAASVQAGWSGLENLALIPGTVGAAPIQNIGAYGVELAEACVGVTAWHMSSGQMRYFDRAACAFSYRDSFFKQPDERHQWVIVSVDFQLSRTFQPKLHYPALHDYPEPLTDAKSVFDAVCQIRQSKLPDPAVLPNAGSFFKNPIVEKAFAAQLHQVLPELPVYSINTAQASPDGVEAGPVEPVKLSAAFLIEQAGLKGLNWHEVGVYAQHALVLVRHQPGPGRAVLDLAHHIQEVVAARFGVNLAPEPEIWPLQP
jgi:UDP-N-acetylmuramate dehydrogenase